MRIGISRKIFIVFFSLTAFTLAMSATVYMGISKMNETTDMTRAISELQAKILLVNAHAHRVLIHDTHTHGEPDYQAFRQKLEEVLELGRYVATFQLQAEGGTRRDLKELPVLVGYYWNAYEELEERLEKGERVLMENDALLTALRERGAALGGETRNRYFQVLSKISLLHGQSYHQLLPGAVRETKSLLEELSTLDDREESGRLAEKIALKLEENYLNVQAIEDRRHFLETTTQAFTAITEDMLRALDAELGQRLKMLKLSILSILAASILVTAMLWLMTTRYAKRALGQLGRAVSSIKKEEYDYDTGKLPQDEFGDLGLFLKEMSLQLSAHIERVRQGERFLQKIIDGIDESIMLVGKDYRVQLLNRKARETTGYSGTGGFTCYEVSHGSKEPCSGDEHPCPLLETVETGEAATYQHVHRAGNGEKRYVEIVASPLRGEDGRIDAVIEASRDITALKEAEESLRKAKEDLELQNIELKKMDRIKDGLLRDVSHELKTPVAKFAMQLEILKPLMEKHRLSASEKKAITVMEESLRRQEGVIRNLLDLSRLEAGGRRFNISTFSLDELIDRVEEDYRHLVEQHSGKIRIDVAPLAIRSDAEMLWHVFSNLFNNAIKFRKKDGPLRISVSAEAEDGTVKIRVADEGEGFSGEEMSRAFDRFYQSTASKEGSGVGLTICKMIVEALGGSIAIHSDGKGQGSVVSVTLPTG